MAVNKFNILCKVQGCKIKSKIAGFIETNYSEMAQGQEDFKIKIHLDFEPEDIPAYINVTCSSPEGFETKETFDLEPKEAAIDFELPITYTHAQIGYFTIEGQVLHEEFGTELTNLDASFFHLKVPKVTIKSCNVYPEIVTRGDKFEINVGLSTTAPQKIKGTISGKLKPSEDTTSARVYELEPQKIAVKDERTITWNMKIHRDEEQIADYFADLKFESKETTAEEKFVDVMKLKRVRDIQVISLEADESVVSGLDSINFSAKVKNIGMEIAHISLTTGIDDPEGNSIDLPSSEISLLSDEEHSAVWKWQVPEGAAHGLYQLNVNWKFAETGESGTVPGETIEVKARHQMDIKTLTTDKDYYLSGQNVRLNIFITDAGTRAGQYPIEVEYKVLNPKGKELHKEINNVTIDEKGIDLKLEWPIPAKLTSGSLDFNIALLHENDELTSRKFKKLINVERPILLNFDIIQPLKTSNKKNYNKYLLEGEKVAGEKIYHDLKIIELSSQTNLMLYDNQVIGGIKWYNADRSKIRHTEDLIFSYFMLNRGMNINTLSEIRKHWNELGFIWSAKLINVGKSLRRLSSGDRNYSGHTKDAFQSKQITIKNKVIDRLKNYLAQGSTNMKDWKHFVEPLIAPVKFVDYKNMREILDYTYDEKYGNSIMGLTMEYLEYGKINDDRRLAGAMNEFIKTLNSRVSLQEPKDGNTIPKSLERWYTYLKNPRIEIESDDEISNLLDLLYSLVMIKMVARVVDIIDTVKTENKITKKQFLKLCFSMISYHILNIEYIHYNIRYNRFMEEDINKDELATHFSMIEEIGTELESILTNVRQLASNHSENMKLRSEIALLQNNIKFIGDSNIMNGLSGDHVSHRLKFKNKSANELKFNILFAFPSMDWHLLKPESNLIDGVYWLEDISTKPKEKHNFDVTVGFPKSLSLKEYKCLVKFEPLDFTLLSEK